MFLQFFFWHICRVMIVQVVVYAGHVFYIIENFSYVVTYDDDGAFLVDLFQHFVHLLLKSAVDVGIRLVENNDIWLGNDGTCRSTRWSCPPLKAPMCLSFKSDICILSRVSATCWWCCLVYLAKRLLLLLSPERTTSYTEIGNCLSKSLYCGRYPIDISFPSLQK